MMPDDSSDEPIADIVPEPVPGEVPQAHEDIGEIEEIGPTFDLSIFIEPQGVLCQFQCEGRSLEWSVPKTVVRRAHKAMSIDHVFDLLGAGPIIGYQLREAVTNNPEFLMVPRAVNTLTDRVTKALRQVQKALRAEAAAEESPGS
ncbi:MAG: hypothetical protein ACLP9L_04885 [Thermoguttaceae bacterium]